MLHDHCPEGTRSVEGYAPGAGEKRLQGRLGNCVVRELAEDVVDRCVADGRWHGCQ